MNFRIAALPLLCSLALASLALNSCVTLNVSVAFPEGAVQKATDDYVRDLYRAKEKGKNPSATPTAAPQSSRSGFSIFSSEAFADEQISFSLDSEKAEAIKVKLAGILDDVLIQKRSGTVGETKDGLLSLQSPDKIKPLLKQKLEKLIREENDLRKELYQEVLASNHLPKKNLKDIERSFSRSFQAESPSGTYVQDADGNWSRKP